LGGFVGNLDFAFLGFNIKSSRFTLGGKSTLIIGKEGGNDYFKRKGKKNIGKEKEKYKDK